MNADQICIPVPTGNYIFSIAGIAVAIISLFVAVWSVLRSAAQHRESARREALTPVVNEIRGWLALVQSVYWDVQKDRPLRDRFTLQRELVTKAHKEEFMLRSMFGDGALTDAFRDIGARAEQLVNESGGWNGPPYTTSNRDAATRMSQSIDDAADRFFRAAARLVGARPP